MILIARILLVIVFATATVTCGATAFYNVLKLPRAPARDFGEALMRGWSFSTWLLTTDRLDDEGKKRRRNIVLGSAGFFVSLLMTAYFFGPHK